ncbi:unnamed protein product [Cladocopium goreaui]|uniref:Ankyrin-2 n=1 Tax=Cladocopium goreaui TaxID=2562237 RepID=A0A9P1CVN4_9DINO|nr:unnamed protein product [Cladocopium goreaui]
MNRSRLAQRYPAGLVNAILIAYASSIGLGHHLLYLVEGNAVFEKEKSLENNLILCGDLCPEGQLSTACRSADGNPPELPRPGLLAEVHPLDEPEEKEKFPGTHPLSLEALVKRAHEGLGHPGKDRFIRILTNSKASPKVLEIAKNLKCSVCEKFKLPRPSRAAAPPKDIGLNEIVGVDTIQLRASFSEKTKYCINIIDYSSHFQLIVPLTAHTAEATRAGYRLWLKIFGPPRKLLCDLGREFQKQFETLAEADGSELIPSSLETPEQRGFVERHGQLFKEVFYKTIEQTKCSTWDEWYQTIDLACSTKNRLLSRGGFSPAQRVFVFQQRIPGGLMSEGESDLAVQSLAATGDVNVSRSMMIRKAAAQSFHEVDCQQAIRAAATHGPRPHYAYETGQAVYFWRRATDAARKPASYFWHGPARVVATQLPTTVWLSYNHHLVKAAPEKLRPASEEEFFSISGWLEGISNAKKQFEASKVKGLIDLSQENDELPPAELHDFWRQEGNFWIRVHVQPRRELFHPEERGQDPPVPPSHLRPWRRSVMNITDGDQEILEDDWTSGNGIPAHRQEWTGETWLEEKIDEPSRLEQKREADPLVPRSRLSKKSRVEPEQMIPFSQAPMATPETALETPEPIPVMPGAPPGLPAPDPPLPEVPLPDPPEVEPQQETRPLDDNHQHPEERKREFVEVDQPDADWSSLPVSKRSRLELLEIYYQEISNKSAQRQKKGKEATLRDFQGKDRERLLRAIHKEFNNNLATGAYEVLTPQESARIRASSPEKIMKSRYVLTKKPIEDCGLEDAISADEILDSSEKDQPCKAKCRHVMQGYSESALLDLETSTPQVHRDSVIFAAQIMASKHWTPGFADFTQAFHSGDPIDRELYAEQPAEGLPGASKGQLLKLKKTCYGLTDGPYAWFKHIVTFLCEQLGYRQSVVDQCLFFLDSEPDAEGKSSIEGIIALATDDLFHGGSQRHFQLMEIIRSKYKLGKYTWGQGRFVGKDIRQLEDFSILVDQQFYTEARVAPIPLQRERKRRRFSVCNPEETEQLRALVGTLSWLSKETRCDLAGKTALLQQAFPRPMIRDIITANQIAQEALDHKHLGIRAMSIPLDRLHAGVVTDASWGNSKEFGTYLEAGTTKDRWEETSTSWIRHHVDPRITAFHPAACPDGPDLHDLRPERSTEIRTGSRSTTFQDDWTTSDSLRSMSSSTWTGTTTFYKQDEGKSLDSKAIHAGYDQLNKLFSQGGEIVIFYDQDLPKSQTLQNVSLASWKSYRLKRRTVNTLSSETQARRPDPHAMTQNKLLDARKREYLEYNMRNFPHVYKQMPMFSEQEEHWWKMRKTYVAEPWISKNKEKPLTGKVTETFFAEPEEEQDYTVAAGGNAVDVARLEHIPRWSQHFLPKGLMAKVPRHFDRLFEGADGVAEGVKNAPSLSTDTAPLDSFSSFRVIRDASRSLSNSVRDDQSEQVAKVKSTRTSAVPTRRESLDSSIPLVRTSRSNSFRRGISKDTRRNSRHDLVPTVCLMSAMLEDLPMTARVQRSTAAQPAGLAEEPVTARASEGRSLARGGERGAGGASSPEPPLAMAEPRRMEQEPLLKVRTGGFQYFDGRGDRGTATMATRETTSATPGATEEKAMA